jgi:8-hydroxy-5-deazaflavin:NADPH oxidoreductase
MKIGIVGAGRIGGGIARQLTAAGHGVLLSFSRDPQTLERLAAEMGPSASAGTPADAVAFGEVVVFSVPWSTWPQALEQTGPLTGRGQAGRGPGPQISHHARIHDVNLRHNRARKTNPSAATAAATI